MIKKAILKLGNLGKRIRTVSILFTILFLVILIPSLLRADVIISEMCDPLNGYATDRYIEIYNTGVSAVDLTGWTLYSIGNDNETYQTWPLSGSIASAEALVCGKEGNIYADFTNTSANTSWNGDSNDGARLLNDSAVVVDYVKDAAAAYFSNSSYVRKATVENAVAVYDSGEWDKLAVSDINTGNSTPGTHTCDYPVPTPPAGISSLSALVGLSNGTVRLKWLDPGADGIGGGNVSSYEVKYATFCIDSEENYAAATTYDAASAWSAGTFGTEHEIKTVSGLIDAATYWFAIKASDGNDWGIWPGSYGFGAYTTGISTNDINSYYAYGAPDVTPPCAISNLTALSGDSLGTVKLKWTAPGDDGAGGGNCSSYRLKYATFQITTDLWDALNVSTYTPAETDPWSTGTAGDEKNAVVSGLTLGNTYFFAIKAKDESGNWSFWSATPYAGNENSVYIPVPPPADHVVISQIGEDYDGELAADYVELYNPTNQPVDLSGASVQRGLGEPGSITKQNLTGTISAYGFYMIGDADATTYSVTPDDTNSSWVVNDGDWIAFVDAQTDITDKSDPNIIDFVGLSPNPSYFEGSGCAPDPNAGYCERLSEFGDTAADMQTGGSRSLFGNAFDAEDNAVDFVWNANHTLSKPQSSSSPHEIPSAPSITSFSPASAPKGEEVNIYGSYFGGVRVSSNVTSHIYFYDNVEVTSYVSWSDTHVIVEVPAGFETGKIWMCTQDDFEGHTGTETTTNFTVPVPPEAISNLTALAEGTGLGGQIKLEWTAPAQGDNPLSSYDVRWSTAYINESNFDLQMSSSFSAGNPDDPEGPYILTGFDEGTTYFFAIRTKDTIGAWSVWSGTSTDANTKSFTVPTDSAPAAINDITASTGTYEGEVDLIWTATGDDGTIGDITNGQWKIRYSFSSTHTWSAMPYECVIPTNVASGAVCFKTITGLNKGDTYYFYIEAGDERPNWSSLSNKTTARANTDMVPPGKPSGVTTEPRMQIKIEWTSPGDNGYTGDIAGGKWKIAYSSNSSKTPDTAEYSIEWSTDATQGTVHSRVLTGLRPRVTYYFWISARDEIDSEDNWSVWSDTATGTPGTFLYEGILQALPSATRGNTIAWGDYDNDGDLDAVIGNYNAASIIYRNDGDGTFTDTGQTAGTGLTMAIAWGDYDNDGDLDILVGNRGTAANLVYKNNGDGTFVNIWTSAEGENTYSVAWGDYDNDGYLDQLVGNNSATQPNRVYKNNGDGTFTAIWASTEMELTYSAAWGDYDNDGYLDQLVGNYSAAQPNRVYKNNGDGTFTAIWASAEMELTYSVAWGDYDNDGDLDQLVGNNGADNRVYENDGGTFASAVTVGAGATFAIAWGDYNNDGFLDIAVGNYNEDNYVYKNNGDKTFTLMWTSEWDPDSASHDATYAIEFADTNNDGDIDIVVGNFNEDNVIYKSMDADYGNINSAPLAPGSGFSSSYVPFDPKGALQLRWAKGTDDETSQDGLYYEIRAATKTITDSLEKWIVSPSMGAGAEPFTGNYPHGFISATETGANLNPTLEDATYFWQVRTRDPGWKKSDWSTEQSTYIPNEPPTTPYLFSPEDGLATNQVTITFEWTGSTDAVSGLKNYELQISTALDFAVYDSSATKNLSAEVNISTTGVNYWKVGAIDNADNSVWTSTRSFELDIAPPAAISDLTALAQGTGLGSQITLIWTAPGDDGPAGGNVSQFLVKYSTNHIGGDDFYAGWVSTYGFLATGTDAGSTESRILTGFNEGTTYWLAITAEDNAANWSVWPGTSAVINFQNFSVPTGSAPATITTLQAATGSGAGEINLTWIAPGDDGFTGDLVNGAWKIKYSLKSTHTWEDMTSTVDISTSVGQGTECSYTVTGLLLAETSYYFYIEAGDECPNWSELSNKTTAHTLDAVLPAAISDLTALAGNNGGEVQLKWTSPGDDGTIGSIVGGEYLIKYSKVSIITKDNFFVSGSTLTISTGTVPGEEYSTIVPGLLEGTSYWFAVKTKDETGYEWSVWNSSQDVSTVNTLAYSSPKDEAPGGITDLQAATGSNPGEIVLTWSSPGDDGTAGKTETLAGKFWIKYSLSSTTVWDEGADEMELYQNFPFTLTPGMECSKTIDNLSLSQTTYYFYIKAGDEKPNWSELSNKTTAYTLDAVPPAAISNLTALEGDAAGEITLKWTAPGDDGMQNNITGGEYRLKYSSSAIITKNNFDSPPTTYTVTTIDISTDTVPGDEHGRSITGLLEGTSYWFAIKTRDEAGNWAVWNSSQDVSTVNLSAYHCPKDSAPAKITVLQAVTGSGAGEIDLTWTAPGDDGTVGNIENGIWRIKYSSDSSHTWDTMSYFIDISTSVAPGDDCSYTVTGLLLAETSYYFYIEAGDEKPNWSELSNKTTSYTLDAIPPGAISDLTALAEGTGSGQITLKWTAPGDDEMQNNISSGAYKIKYSSVAVITTDNFDSPPATYTITTIDISTDTVPGVAHSRSITGLLEGTTYWFAIKTEDDAGNWAIWPGTSAVINSQSFGVSSDSAPAKITDLQAETGSNAGEINLSWTATGDDGNVGNITNGKWKIKWSTIAGVDWSSGSWDDYDDKYELLIDTDAAVLSGHSKTITSLHKGVTYYFKISAGDEKPNWSDLSNTTTAQSKTELVPPGKITGFAYQSGVANVVLLQWITPGDDEYSNALPAGSEYRIQYSSDLATVIWSTSTPNITISTSGVTPGVYVSSYITLTVNEFYYFRIWTKDDVDNWSIDSDNISVFNSPYDFETVSSDSAEYTSIAVDISGDIHVSYHSSGDLKYAKRTGETWDSPETVDSVGDVGEYTSIALDVDGNPHISYYDATNNDLKYAKWTGTAWSTQTVDSVGGVGKYTSIAIDGLGNPHISYCRDVLKYAKWTGSEWNIQIVDSVGNLGAYTIALDGSGNPHIAYCNNFDLKYAEWTGSEWNIETVDDTVTTSYASIALDGSGNPHISYYTFTGADLKYVKRTDAGWNTPQIIDSSDAVGKYNSITLDGSGNPHISYYDSTNEDLKYIGWTGTSWSTRTIDSLGDLGKYTSIALDGSGDAHISYSDDTNNDLKYATWVGADLTAPMGGNARGKVQAPTSFSAGSISTASVAWSWTNNSSNALGYRVYCSSAGGSFFLAEDTSTLSGNSQTGWSQTGLTPNTSYQNYAAAVNAGGVVTSSSSIALTLANPPSEIQVSSVSTTSVALNWSANGNPSYTRWEILSSTDNFISTKTLTNFASNYIETNYSDSGLTAATTYWYKIRAFNEDEIETSFGETISTKTTSLPPSAPAGFTGVALSTTSIKWSWEDGDYAAGYRIKNDTGGTMDNLSADATYWMETNLSTNTAYYRFVEAYNEVGTASSTAKIVYTLTLPPSAVTTLSKTEHSIKLSWTGNGGTMFKVDHSIDESNWTILESSDTNFTDTTYDDTKLLQNTTYYYRIYAYNGDGIITDYVTFSLRTNKITETIIPAGSTATVTRGGVSVDVAADSFGEDGYIKISTNPLNDPIEIDTGTIVEANGALDSDSQIALSGSLAEFKAYNLQGATITFVSSVTISLPYLSSDGKFVDGYSSPKIPVASLVIYVLDESAKRWTSVSKTADTVYKVMKATVSHFSVYMIIGEPVTVYNDLSGVVVYPNPYKPGSGGDYDDAAGGGIVFAKLTENVKIKIFNIAGELVKELNHTSGSTESWADAKNQASGVYIYVVTGNSGKKTGKFAIIK